MFEPLTASLFPIVLGHKGALVIRDIASLWAVPLAFFTCQQQP